MKTKINVFNKETPKVHQWTKYAVVDEPKDKYELHFQNRFIDTHVWEEYTAEQLQALAEDSITYNVLHTAVGALHSTWRKDYPNRIQFDEYDKRTIDPIAPSGTTQFYDLQTTTTT